MSDKAGAGSRRAGVSAILLTGCICGAAALLALPLIPAANTKVGPATITARAELGAGRTRFLVPPLGTVVADTHIPPLTLTLSLAEVDLPSLGDAVADSAARADLTAEVEADLRGMSQRVLVRFLLGAAVIGALLAALIHRRKWPHVVAGASGGVLIVGLVLFLSAANFDVDAFQEPRFTGALVRAPVVIEALSEGELSLPEIRSRYERAAERLSQLLALLAVPDVDPRTDTTALLHVSDIHSNPIGMEIVKQLARQFDVDAVLDTGDIGSYGLPIESAIGNLVEDVRVPYYFVPGNHDSSTGRRAIARVPNVTLIDKAVVQIEGIDVLGWADPTYTNWNLIPVEEANEIRVAEGEEVVEAVRFQTPDVLAVHDARMAEASVGEVALVLSGHDHKRRVEERDGTVILTVGSTGATGLKSFTLETDMQYEAEVVYFREADAVAVDYISFSGLGGDFEVQRQTLGTD